jgi:hypothetical protein
MAHTAGGEEEDDKNTPMVPIYDSRTCNDFKQMTFSKFRKIDVRRELMASFLKEDAESANFWVGEFLCAGHGSELWEIIGVFISKHIVNANPKLAIYLDMRLQNYVKLLKTIRAEEDPLEARNSPAIRKLFAEVASIVCFSMKRPTYEFVKIKRVEEFDLATWTDRLKAPSSQFVRRVFHSDDPREAFIPCNEFAYALRQREMVTCAYWIEWILEFETICRRKKEKIVCDRRNYPVPFKFQTDVIWMFWDILLISAADPNLQDGNDGNDGNDDEDDNLYEEDRDIAIADTTVDSGPSYLQKPSDNLPTKIVKSLVSLFSYNYSLPAAKRRRSLLYHAIYVLTERGGGAEANLQIPILSASKKNEIRFIITHTDEIYREIAKSSHRDTGNYLFMDMADGTQKSTGRDAPAGPPGRTIRLIQDGVDDDDDSDY